MIVPLMFALSKCLFLLLRSGEQRQIVLIFLMRESIMRPEGPLALSLLRGALH